MTVAVVVQDHHCAAVRPQRHRDVRGPGAGPAMITHKALQAQPELKQLRNPPQRAARLARRSGDVCERVATGPLLLPRTSHGRSFLFFSTPAAQAQPWKYVPVAGAGQQASGPAGPR
jgi:hypothetical protein